VLLGHRSIPCLREYSVQRMLGRRSSMIVWQSLQRMSSARDGSSIKDTDLTKWIALTISWGSQCLLEVALRRFKDFLEIMGPKESRIKGSLDSVVPDPPTFAFRSEEPFSSHIPITICTQGSGFTRIPPNSPGSNMIRHDT
jgi:hypothetical protein